MPDTVAALFDDEAQAEFAVHALRSARFASASTHFRRTEPARMPDFGAHAVRGLEVGYLAGTFAGMALGIVAAGLIPHSHVFVQGGLFVPFILAIAFGVTGGLAGLLVSAWASRDHAIRFEREVKSSPYMVTVITDPERVEYARKIMMSKGAIETSRLESRPMRRSGRRVVG
jgi:hypothetical protein